MVGPRRLAAVTSSLRVALGLLVQSLPIGLNLLADLPEPLKDAM
jgi:hypothetical protein